MSGENVRPPAGYPAFMTNPAEPEVNAMTVQEPARSTRIHVEAWSPEYGSPIER